jgi:hypothetical protein
MHKALSIVLWLIVSVAVTTEAGAKGQQGAKASGPTTGREMEAPFNLQYFLGKWEIEWAPPDTALLPGGMYTGTETVTHIENRFLKIEIALKGERGNMIAGQGVLFYDWGLGGQSMVRYVVYDAGFSLLQYGPLGGDLGGYYSHFWQTPEFALNDHRFTLKGRSYFVSPAAYRVDQQISVEGKDFFNFGTMWMTKEAAPSRP